MNFGHIDLDDETLAFWAEVRDWFDRTVTSEMLDEERATGAGFIQPVHAAMGKRGWIFPTWPVEEGGAGLSELQAAILALEFNAHRVPFTTGLSTTRLVAPAIDEWLDGDLRRELLQGAARGEIVFCLGYTEPDGGSDLAGVRTRAGRDGDEWVISGQKMFTSGAEHSHYSFLLARSDPDAAKHKGLTMFLVPLDSPGIEIRPVRTLAGERTNMVFYDDVRVADRFRVGPEAQGWMVLHGPLDREHQMGADGPKPVEEQAGEMARAVSLLSVAHAAALAWARLPDHDGLRPLDDPIVRSRLAEIELGLTVAEITPGPLGRVVSSDLFIHHAADLVDLVGPHALIARGQSGARDDGAIEYAHRFAQGTAIYGGTTDVVRNLIAERFMGMPRSRPK